MWFGGRQFITALNRPPACNPALGVCRPTSFHDSPRFPTLVPKLRLGARLREALLRSHDEGPWPCAATMRQAIAALEKSDPDAFTGTATTFARVVYDPLRRRRYIGPTFTSGIVPTEQTLFSYPPCPPPSAVDMGIKSRNPDRPAVEPVLKHGPNTACGGNARKRASPPHPEA